MPTTWPKTRPADVCAGSVSFAAVAGLAAESGGFAATTWGWAAVGLCAVAVGALAVSGLPRLRSAELVVLGAIVCLTAWTFVSVGWSRSVTRSILEGERSIVYVAALLAAVLVSRRAGGRAVVTGTWLAVTAVCVYALLTRLFPHQFGAATDALGDYRLSAPIGYWNGLGFFAAVGLLLATGLVARGERFARACAAASTVVFATTLYFTFSRGAWMAVIGGACAALAVDRRRLQLAATALVVAPWSALAVYAASRAHALTRTGSPIDAAQSDGRTLAFVLLGLIALAAGAALAFDVVEARWHPGDDVLRRFALGLVCLALLGFGLVFARFGSPVTIARHSWHSFTNEAVLESPNLNSRLFQLSGNGRTVQWRVAWAAYDAHPWLGTGAGTFGESWYAGRPTDANFVVHDVHNLYLEMLTELGPLGLVLVVVALGAAIVAAVRSRSPFAGVAVGGLVAYALHSSIDWDWELPALLVAVLFPAVAVLGDPPRAQSVAARSRLVPAAIVLGLGGLALFGLLGNIALARSGNAADASHWRQAASEARSAMDLAPWSAEPWRKLAVAQAGLGQSGAASKSLREAVRKEPADWSLWYQLSEVSTSALQRRAQSEVTRLNPHLWGTDATPGDLRRVVVP